VVLYETGEFPLSSSFHLLHRDDLNSDPATLRQISTWEEIREVIRLDRNGSFRPLRAAPNLPSGWRWSGVHLSFMLRVLDYFYPATLANWSLALKGQLQITSWRETAERQTGRFRIVREIDEAALQELVAGTCDTGCQKQRLWSPAAETISAQANEIPLLCPEACNYFVGKAREKLKGTAED